MSAPEWTEGCWSLVKNGIHEGSVSHSIYSDGGDYVADVYAGYVGSEKISFAEAEANGNLIKASPDMADALHQWKVAEETGDEAELEAARKSRDAALAKARGES